MERKVRTGPMTAEELMELPDDGLQYELLGGRLVSEPPAGATHGDIETRLLVLVGSHVQRKRLGRVFSGDTGFILARSPDTVRAPDVAFVSQERIDRTG